MNKQANLNFPIGIADLFGYCAGISNEQMEEYKAKEREWLTCAPALFVYLPKKCPAAHRGLVLLNWFVHHPLEKGEREKKYKAKCTVLFYGTGKDWF